MSAIAPDSRLMRRSDRRSKCGRNRCVDRISASREDGLSHLFRRRLAADCPVLRGFLRRERRGQRLKRRDAQASAGNLLCKSAAAKTNAHEMAPLRVPGFRFQADSGGAWHNIELGTWNLEPGTWNLELETWNLSLARPAETWNLPPLAERNQAKSRCHHDCSAAGCVRAVMTSFIFW